MCARGEEATTSSSFLETKGLTSGVLSSRGSVDDAKQHSFCETSKQFALKHPAIRTLVDAMENQDCNFDLQRNISCRRCVPNVAAGFSPQDNHIILCQNACTSQSLVTVNLGHELVHVYDNCRANVDFTNLRHLACTEDCVKDRALRSVQLQTGTSLKRAESAVNNVFDQCYNDISPFGDHLRTGVRNSSRRNYTYY